jgi:hypothetical protein
VNISIQKAASSVKPRLYLFIFPRKIIVDVKIHKPQILIKVILSRTAGFNIILDTEEGETIIEKKGFKIKGRVL